jgi:phospholipid/cholesterol/gamma-HCH transport system substrate-binding protein
LIIVGKMIDTGFWMKQKIELKVGLFIIITTMLIIASVGYVAYKKDVFSPVYRYTLTSKTGENITEGMPVVFWGFNIGHVSSMELTEKGVLVEIKVPERNNRVIRAGSKFYLEKPLLGTSRIVVITNDLKGPTLSPTVIPEIIISNDINESIKQVQAIAEKLDKIAENLTTITGKMADPQGDMSRTLQNIQKVTSQFAEKKSLIEMVSGNPDSAKSIQEILDNAHAITVSVDGVVKKLDTLAGKTDVEMYGQDGFASLIRNILKDLQAKLAKVDVTLDNLNKTTGNTADATKDLTAVRNDLDEMLLSITTLVDELDRMIPFKDEPEIKLP